MLRQVDRIAVAGKLGEADDVGRGDSFLQPLGHADRKVFEEQRAQRGANSSAYPHPAGASLARWASRPVLSKGPRNIAAVIHSITLSALEKCRSSMDHTGTNIRAWCVLDRLQ